MFGTAKLEARVGGDLGQAADIQAYWTETALTVTIELNIADPERRDALLKELREAERIGRPTVVHVSKTFRTTGASEKPGTINAGYTGIPRNCRRTADGVAVTLYTAMETRDERVGCVTD